MISVKTALTFVCLLALSVVAVASTGGASPAAAATANRFGIIFVGAKHIRIGQKLGVSYQRVSTSLTAGDGSLTTFKDLHDAGFGVVVTYKNTCNPPPLSCPVTDPAAYRTSLRAHLDATLPALVVIENEEDGVIFGTATPAQYLQELTYAVQVAHAKGYKITNGGITMMGLNLATWHHLWRSGPCAVADDFASRALSGLAVKNRKILDDIPNCSNPDRHILSQNELLRTKLHSVKTLIAGYKATGIDYVNFHLYEGDPVTMGQAVTYFERATGLPAVSNEMGQYSLSGDTVTGLLRESIALKLPYAIWYASDGLSGSPIVAVGLADHNGALRVNGAAYRDYIATHR